MQFLAGHPLSTHVFSIPLMTDGLQFNAWAQRLVGERVCVWWWWGGGEWEGKGTGVGLPG